MLMGVEDEIEKENTALYATQYNNVQVGNDASEGVDNDLSQKAECRGV